MDLVGDRKKDTTAVQIIASGPILAGVSRNGARTRMAIETAAAPALDGLGMPPAATAP